MPHDSTPMTEDRFWSIVEHAKQESGGSVVAREAILIDQLTKLSSAELIKFNEIIGRLVIRTYTWDLWAAADIVFGGWSGDDSFAGFRYWVISLGREAYERALADPDSLADVEGTEDDISFERFGYLARREFEERYGTEMPCVRLDVPNEPTGRRRDYDELPAVCPRLYAQNKDFWMWEPRPSGVSKCPAGLAD